MAKLIDPNLFSKTEPAAAAQPQAAAADLHKRQRRIVGDPITSKGVGLRTSVWVKFGAVADELGTNYHDLAVYVLTDFLARWDRGERPPTETKQVLKRP